MTRALHWVMALLIAVEIPLGFWMVNLIEADTEAQNEVAWVLRTAIVHHTIGFLVLILAFFRANWRLNNPTPDLPPSLTTFQRYLTRSTQLFLYLLMFFYPLTGWAVLSASTDGLPVFFFGWEMPRMFPPQAGGSTFAYDLFADLHQACWKVGGVILTLHISGALWYQFIREENILLRMWRGR